LLCVIEKPHEWGGHGPRWAAAPQEKKPIETVLVRPSLHFTTLVDTSLLPI